MTKIHFPGAGTLLEETYLDGVAVGEAKGQAKERVRVILRALEIRGIPVPPSARERITTCTNPDTLQRWLDRAITPITADDLFTEDDE